MWGLELCPWCQLIFDISLIWSNQCRLKVFAIQMNIISFVSTCLKLFTFKGIKYRLDKIWTLDPGLNNSYKGRKAVVVDIEREKKRPQRTLQCLTFPIAKSGIMMCVYYVCCLPDNQALMFTTSISIFDRKILWQDYNPKSRSPNVNYRVSKHS